MSGQFSMPARHANVVAECARASPAGRRRNLLPTFTEVMTQTTLATAADVSPLPFEAYRELHGRRAGRADRLGQAANGRLTPDSGTPLSAGRGHPLRRPTGRQLQVEPARRRQPNVPRDRVLRRPFHGRNGRCPLPRRRSRFTSRIWPPGAAWPTWPTSNRSRRRGKTSRDVIDTNDITPVTYINSSAELKAFCGRHGGIVCTSSNARAVLDWSFSKRGRVLFFPDQHLGRNTARAMGIPLDQMAVWDPREPLGGNTEAGDRRQPGLALERPLLGPSDVQTRSRQAIPGPVS